MDYRNCTIVYVDKEKQAQVVRIVDGELTDPFRTLFSESISLLKKMQKMQESIDSGMLNGDELDICSEAMGIYLDKFRRCRELIDEGLKLRRNFMLSYNNTDGCSDYLVGCACMTADACTEICRNVRIHTRDIKSWTCEAAFYIKKSFDCMEYAFEDIFTQWKSRIMRIKCTSLRTGFCLALKKCVGDMLNSARKENLDSFITDRPSIYSRDDFKKLHSALKEAVKLCSEASEDAVSSLAYGESFLKIGLERCSRRPEHFHESPENTLEMQIRYDQDGRRFGFLNGRYLFTSDIKKLAEGCRQLIDGKSGYFEFKADHGFYEDYYCLKIRSYDNGFIVTERIYDELSSEKLVFVKEMSLEQFVRFAGTFMLWETAYPVRLQKEKT